MQNIGERLEEARKRKGVSIREAAEATKIRSDYLHKFESNQFDLNLADIYVRGFLRNYAYFLKLPAEKILNDYASLGRGESRPRQPSREVYGRMEVSIASAEERQAEKNSSAPEENPAPAEPRRSGGLNRSGSSLPQGPAISPQLIFKGGIALAGVIVLIVIVWAIKSIVSDPTPTTASTRPAQVTANPVQAAADNTVTLIALDTLRVKVMTVEGGRVLLADTTLVRGQTETVVKTEPIYIYASAGKNLQIEIKGKRYPMPFEGYDRAKIN